MRRAAWRAARKAIIFIIDLESILSAKLSYAQGWLTGGP
jgi:hypothetical protein